jgi:hypothetical protein
LGEELRQQRDECEREEGDKFFHEWGKADQKSRWALGGNLGAEIAAVSMTAATPAPLP